jgi:transcriptional regulator of acetoin/glycerol metabolism
MVAARDQASREYLVSLMHRFQGNVTHAAKQAGMTRVSLHRLLRKYGVHSLAFKPGE